MQVEDVTDVGSEDGMQDERCVFEASSMEEVAEDLGELIEQIASDEELAGDMEEMDLDLLFGAMVRFEENIGGYVRYLDRERRLQAIKLARGTVPERLEHELQEMADEGIASLEASFAVAGVLDAAEMIVRLDRNGRLAAYLDEVTSELTDPQSPVHRIITSSFRAAGFPQAAVADFLSASMEADNRFIREAGSLEQVVENGKEGVTSLIEIARYTKEDGLSYMRGGACCGPPGWAVAVAKFLGWIGISISAWKVVIILAALIVIIVAVCFANRRNNNWLRRACDWLAGKKVPFAVFG